MLRDNLLSAFFIFFLFFFIFSHLFFAALFSSDCTSGTVYPGLPLPLLRQTTSSLPQQDQAQQTNSPYVWCKGGVSLKLFVGNNR